MPGEFDKDFGYLMPFLDKVAGAAQTLTNPAARAELTRLVADEKAKWTRIRELLSGATGQAQPAPQVTLQSAPATSTAKPVMATTDPPATAPTVPSPIVREPLNFTVGSLRPKR
jgi:hypothetical protein